MAHFLCTVDADWVPGSGAGLAALLRLFDEAGLKATLFATGRFCLAYPDLIRSAVRSGHEIGVHGWEHPMPRFRAENYRFTPLHARRAWLLQATRAVADVVGRAPRAFRAPFLWTDAATFGLLEDLGYTIDSSVPARRFDGLLGVVNHLDYFRAPLAPYHPDRERPARRGTSPVLEIPPSAWLLPLNMSTLRFVGLRGTMRVTRLVAKCSPVVNFYCHPWEFVEPSAMEFPPGTPPRHTRSVGPQWLRPLQAFVETVRSLGYQCRTISEVAACASW
ncbi:MAG: polysaccharide deacetylase family protein [Armatimonadota bacterium]|nr:polysaccharide deacetylase family protein [Armatimonadota bacterium]MDR7549004.1 polysaccharide deacetylase family protein [Armatimonadota bacterium]